MLDFYGLFPSYVALFPGGVYMEIEYLRLDLHLKTKQKKPQGQHQRFHQRRKKKKQKKTPEKKVFIREEGKKKKKKNHRQSRSDLGSPRRELGRGARPRPVSPAWIWRGLGLELISISSSSSSLSFFFSFFLRLLPLFLHFGLHFGSLIFYFWVRNRVLETRFPCRRHLEKVPRKRQKTHENRALKTRFRSPKSSI